jgi:nucleoside-diphosphate-sugar epimerase
MVRVLVTGSHGSLGRVACTAAQNAGHFVRGFDRAGGAGDAVYDRSATPAPRPDEFVQAELRDKVALARAMEGMDVVIHLAATPDDLTAFDAPGGIADSNIMGVYNVCDAARTAGVKCESTACYS